MDWLSMSAAQRKLGFKPKAQAHRAHVKLSIALGCCAVLLIIFPGSIYFAKASITSLGSMTQRDS